MMSTLPIQTSELCPLTTRLIPKELSHAFGIADEQTYDSRSGPASDPSPAAAAPVGTPAELPTPAQAGSNVAAMQKRKAPDQQQQQAAVMLAPAAAGAASSMQQPAASITQSFNGAAASTAPMQASSMLQGQSASQQATSNISAGLQQQTALQAAVVGGQLRGFPAAYISPHGLLPYGQQAVAAMPHLSGEC
jgi:hypothetical protein